MRSDRDLVDPGKSDRDSDPDQIVIRSIQEKNPDPQDRHGRSIRDHKKSPFLS